MQRTARGHNYSSTGNIAIQTTQAGTRTSYVENSLLFFIFAVFFMKQTEK